MTLGAWHIPVAEDSPTTPSLATTSFKLVPFNYFDGKCFAVISFSPRNGLKLVTGRS